MKEKLGGAARKMSDFGYPPVIRILVVGEEKVGKSSLIASFVAPRFRGNVEHSLSSVRIEVDHTDFGIPLVINDTSSRDWKSEKCELELLQADVIILCYACDDALTFLKVKTHWLPFFRSLKINAPIILTGCKSDLLTYPRRIGVVDEKSFAEDYPEIDSFIECSACRSRCVWLVFYHAQRDAIFPSKPLFDRMKGCLKPLCKGALKHIFAYFDKNMDGMLNDMELNNFQVACFGKPLVGNAILNTKFIMQAEFPEGMNECGISFDGFVFLHTLFAKQGYCDMTWTCLRKFGFDNHIQRKGDFAPTWNSRQVCNDMNSQPNLTSQENKIFQSIVLALQNICQTISNTEMRRDAICTFLPAAGVTFLGGLAALHIFTNKKTVARGERQ